MGKTLNIIDKLLSLNTYSRWGKSNRGIKALVIHWVQNTNTSATFNRNYFENRKFGTTDYGSAHYIVDLNGDVIRCIPDKESAFHCGSKKIDPASGEVYTDLAREKFGQYAIDYINQSPNSVTIGIECTHIKDNGEMANETYSSLVQLSSEICKKFSLNADTDILLHQEIVGYKNCHKWFIDNPDKWATFKQEVKAAML